MAPPRAAAAASAAANNSKKNPSCCPAIELPNGWTLGEKLGEGAQGSVYAVVTADNNRKEETEWAVKVTTKPTHPKNKAQAEARANASSLNNEGLLYKAHLKPLRGIIVPRTPEDFQGVQESNGYLYLLMERMESDLFGKLGEMVNTTKSSSISIGPLAEQMVALVHAIHEVKQLVIDVKPENFMFTFGGRSQPLESRLRLVDFGLMRAFARPEVRGDFQGNAMYASLHMHTLHNSSRRDDLEMICYVLGELIIRLHAMVNGTNATYERTSIPSYLPWSQEQSDEELCLLKQLNVENPNSEFYKRMPVPAALTLFECLQLIWAYKFNSTPDYHIIAHKLATLTVPCGSKKTAKASKPEPKRPSRRAAGQENAEVNALVEDSEHQDDQTMRHSGRKVTTIPTPTKRAARTIATQTDENDISPSYKRHASASSNENGRRRQKRDKANHGPAPMEVEILNIDSDPDSLQDSEMKEEDNDSSNSVGPEQLGIKMIIQTPNQPDFTYTIMGDETVFLGRRPSQRDGTLIEIPGSAEANHIKLTLAIKRRRVVHAVVRDLSTKQGTDVGREGIFKRRPIKKGGESNCMIPGQIYVGDSVIHLQRL